MLKNKKAELPHSRQLGYPRKAKVMAPFLMIFCSQTLAKRGFSKIFYSWLGIFFPSFYYPFIKIILRFIHIFDK
jgi:hypothetical protein